MSFIIDLWRWWWWVSVDRSAWAGIPIATFPGFAYSVCSWDCLGFALSWQDITRTVSSSTMANAVVIDTYYDIMI